MPIFIFTIETIMFLFPVVRYSVLPASVVIRNRRVFNVLAKTGVLLVVPVVAIACGCGARKLSLFSIDVLKLINNEIHLAGIMRKKFSPWLGAFIRSL